MLNKIIKLLTKLLISLPAKTIVGLCIFYILFGYFAIDPLAKRILPWVAENKLASHVSVGKVTFDPLRLKATIENFSITKKSGTPLAGFDKLVVELEASGIFDWAWKFKEISITAPRAKISISSKGELNWADLIAKLNEDKTPPSKTIARVKIRHIAIIRGNMEYVDANRPTPFKSSLKPLDFELDDLSTLSKDRGDYLLSAKFPDQGGSLKWKGNIGINPFASNGSIAVDSIKLAKLLQIVKGITLPLKTSSGEIQGDINYDFSLIKDQPYVALSKIALNLNNLSGTIVNSGSFVLKQAKITVPHLDFSTQNKSELHLQNIAVNLDGLSIQQGKDTHLELKQTSVRLPQLNVALQGDIQLLFQGLNLKLSGLNLTKANEPLLTLPTLDVNQIEFNLAERSVKIAQIYLPNGIVNGSMDKTGTLNWQQAFTFTNTQTNNKNPISTSIKPTMQKAQKPFEVDIADIQFQHWRGKFLDLGLSNPLKMSISDFNLGFTLTTPQGKMEIGKLESNITGFEAKSTLSKNPVATIAKLNLNEGEVSLTNQKIIVPTIKISGFKSELIKEANKRLNWQEILAPITNTSSKDRIVTCKQTKQPEWAISLKKLTLDNSSLHVEDRSLVIPVEMDIEKAQFEIHDSSLNLTKSVPVKAAFQIKQGGHFKIQGKLTPSPFKTNLNFKLTDFTLKPFSAYINQFALLKLNNGMVDLSGNLSIKDNKELEVVFKGGFSVNKLALVEEANNVLFFGWDRISSDNFEVSLAPNLLHLTELQIVKPTGKFIIHEDKSMNITRILRNNPTTVSPTVNTPSIVILKPSLEPTEEEPIAANSIEAGKSAPGTLAPQEAKVNIPLVADNSSDKQSDTFPVNIETVRIDNAELDFADLSLIPQFGTHINSLSGVINGVSTNPGSVAQVELDGKVDDYGSATIRGSLQPFQATNFTDLKLIFKNLEMNRLTPYSGKFAGRRIDSGKLSVDLEYKIKQSHLAGENKFIINKLKLGEKVDSKEAANLPLDFAIAILEDSDGVIDLDLPISGSLDDPKFSYGSIVWKAIKNVLTKIVTAPFRALGKLFVGRSEKLEDITFEAGSAAIAPPEQEKLKSVSQALKKRPGLSLGVVSSYDVTLDSRALQEFTLRKQVAQELGIKLNDGQQPGPIDLTNPKTKKVIDDLYNTLTKRGLLKMLASKLEKPKTGHFEEAQEKLTTSVVVTEANLKTLANSRGEAIQKYLIANDITVDRVHIDSPVKIKSEGKAVTIKLTIDVRGDKNKTANPVNTPSETIKDI